MGIVDCGAMEDFNDTGLGRDFLNFSHRHPGHFGLSSRTDFIISMIVLVTVGIFGNFAFMYVVVTVRSMHTAVNWFFINLSCADTLYLITHLFTWCIKLRPDSMVVQRSQVYSTVISLADGIMLCTSIFTVAAISIERYLAISNPLKARKLTSTKRIVKITVAIWVVSVLFNIPEALNYALKCDESTAIILMSFTAFSQIITFIISLVVVVAMNIATVVMYRKHVRGIVLVSDSRPTRISRQDGQVLVACIGVSVIFLLCAAPTIYRMTVITLIWNKLVPVSFIMDGHLLIFFDVSVVLESVNAITNPLVYNATSSRCRRAFRQALRRLDCKHRCSGRNFLQNSSHSSSSNTQPTYV